MATSYGYLAWEIPRIGEPGGLQSMGLQRVRNDLVTEQQQQEKDQNLGIPCGPVVRTLRFHY